MLTKTLTSSLVGTAIPVRPILLDKVDILSGGESNDTLVYRGWGHAIIFGNGGNDTITGGVQYDWLFGGEGNDTFYHTPGGDTYHGGAGTDTVRYDSATSAVDIDLVRDSMIEAGNTMTGAPGITGAKGGADGDHYVSIENISGSSHNDSIRGDGGTNILAGGDGGDYLNGRGGADLIQGGNGADYIQGGDGNDVIYAGLIFATDSSSDSILGEGGNDTIIGSNGANTLFGGTGDDTISGLLGDDQIVGGDGADILYGESAQWHSGLPGGIDSISGGTGDDVLAGGGGDDRLFGDEGYDGLYGGDGADRLVGGAGADRLAGGEGADHFVFNALADVVGPVGTSGFDIIFDFSTSAFAGQRDTIEIARAGFGLLDSFVLSSATVLTEYNPYHDQRATTGPTFLLQTDPNNGETSLIFDRNGTSISGGQTVLAQFQNDAHLQVSDLILV